MITGKLIKLIPASLADRKEIYHWCFHSETTKSHSGPPDYPEINIPSYQKFCKDYYEDYFFTGSQPEKGRGFLIVNGEEAVGFISYSAFHLKPFSAELDIWMSAEANCGRGFGEEAINILCDYLNQTLGVVCLILAPANKNKRAVRSYEKAGFQRTNKAMKEFLIDDYVSEYGVGDYGVEGTAILVKYFV